MEIVIKNKESEPVYMIKECTGGCPCFELFSWRPDRIAKSGKYVGKKIKAGFVSQGRYPSTLSHALRMIAESITKESSAHFEAIPT